MVTPCTELRDAAQRDDWNGCVDALRDIARNLPAATALALAWTVVSRCYREACSHEEVHEALEPTVTTFDAAIANDNDIAVEVPNVELSSPGGNNLIHALEHIATAVRARAHNLDEFADALASAVAAAIMSTMVGRWGSLHPERWTRWYQSSARGDELPEDLRSFLLEMTGDLTMRAYVRHTWLEVADSWCAGPAFRTRPR